MFREAMQPGNVAALAKACLGTLSRDVQLPIWSSRRVGASPVQGWVLGSLIRRADLTVFVQLVAHNLCLPVIFDCFAARQVG